MKEKNSFKNLGQYKAYLRAIDNFDQLYIIQQGGRGITKEDIIKRLESAIAKDAEGVYYAKKQLWQKIGIITEVFNLVHLSPKAAKVTLVPIAENLTIHVEKVKAIYNKVGVTLDITLAVPFDIVHYTVFIKSSSILSQDRPCDKNLSMIQR